MFIMDVLDVNLKAVAEFFQKYRGLSYCHQLCTPASMTAYPPQLEFYLSIQYSFHEFKRNYCLCRVV